MFLYEKRFYGRYFVSKNRFLFSSVLFLMGNIKTRIWGLPTRVYIDFKNATITSDYSVDINLYTTHTDKNDWQNMIKNTIFSSKLYMIVRNILEMLEKSFTGKNCFFIWKFGKSMLEF
jgi:hypothetical protein